MEHPRIKAIIDAATLLFLRQGYSKTQISHIAKAIGVSVGTIYHDFTGKQEILHFVLKYTIDPDFIEHEFKRPITDDLFKGLNQEIGAAFARSAEDFSKHLENRAEGYSFTALILDTFDFLSRYAVGCLFIEKNHFDFPELTDSYKTYRKHFFDSMIKYITIFIENDELRPMPHPELTARMIIEILTWWTMDQRYISFDPDTQAIPLSLAKEICMDNIVTAYKR